MTKEENIVQELVRKFTYLEGKVEIRRARRISLEVDYANFLEVFDFSAGKGEMVVAPRLVLP